jgi:hypothetical protein
MLRFLDNETIERLLQLSDDSRELRDRMTTRTTQTLGDAYRDWLAWRYTPQTTALDNELNSLSKGQVDELAALIILPTEFNVTDVFLKLPEQLEKVLPVIRSRGQWPSRDTSQRVFESLLEDRRVHGGASAWCFLRYRNLPDRIRLGLSLLDPSR